jgi:hypothetical protein
MWKLFIEMVCMYECTKMRCWVSRHVVHSDSKYAEGHIVHEEQIYSTIYIYIRHTPKSYITVDRFYLLYSFILEMVSQAKINETCA